MRRDDSAHSFLWQEPRKREVIEVRLKLITPMFGGGYTPRVVDPLMPIRPAAIRGHLRFWWRATAGAQYSNSQELYAAETEIWGGADSRGEPVEGKVVVSVSISESELEAVRKSERVVTYSQLTDKQSGKPALRYLLFPFRAESQSGAPEATAIEQLEFSLRLMYKDANLGDDLLKAVKTWVFFGGVGARTRRGCGALEVVRAQINGEPLDDVFVPSLGEALKEWIDKLKPSGTLSREMWTSVFPFQLVIGVPQDKPMECWAQLARFWQEFRKQQLRTIAVRKQNANDSSNQNRDDYRDTLVKIDTFKTLQQSRQEGSQPSLLRLRKPFLGMPIRFQRFENTPFVGDLRPAQSSRYASPVILKPVGLREAKYAPMVALLSGPRPSVVRVDGSLRGKKVEGDYPLENLSTLIVSAIRSAAKDRFQWLEVWEA